MGVRNCAEIGENLKTVVLNINKKRTNVILSDECKNLYGDGSEKYW